METAPLKSFATWARRELITQVSARLTAVLAPSSPERVENQHAVAMLERDIESAGGGAKGKDAVADKVAYTWFNRIIALRFMDANGYTGIGVVSPAHGQQVGQPEILADAKRGSINPAVITNKRTLETITGLLDGTRPSADAQGEAYTLLLAEYCRYWNRSMPFMFEREGDYTEFLIPANLLAADSILTRAAAALTEEVCREVEVIGWLYQFYISERKDDVFNGFKKGRKAGAAEIPAATQLFTPHWIVRYLVENSVGRLWMLNHPESRLFDQMDYYIAPVDDDTDFLKIASPEELTVIDPACGSGHMLTYAFDLLYAIYAEEGYAPSEIPELILTHNLYGAEIDPRAGALAAFALTMKARDKQRTFLSKQVPPSICVVEPISFWPDEIAAFSHVHSDLTADNVFWNQFEHADTLGSLLQPDALQVMNVTTALEAADASSDLLHDYAFERARKLALQAQVLTSTYAVVLANPPYMGGKNMDSRLAAFARDWFPDSKSDLFAMFIERCLMFSAPRGLVAMITMQSWMFISSFRDMRTRIVQASPVSSMLHLGERAFDSIGGAVVSTTAFVLERGGNPHVPAVYVRATEGENETAKRSILVEAVHDPLNERRFTAASEEFARVPGAPLAYWLSDAMKSAFSKGRPLRECAEPRKGMDTGDNGRFLRAWWEVSCRRTSLSEFQAGKWVPYNKGGGFRRWYGYREYLLDWRDEGSRMRTRSGARYFGREGWTWGTVTTGGLSLRFTPEGAAFDNGGCTLFSDHDLSIAALVLNSTTADAMLAAISPTLNFQPINIGAVPLVASDALAAAAPDIVRTLVDESRADWDSFETSWDFQAPVWGQVAMRGERLADVTSELSAQFASAASDQREREATVHKLVAESYGLVGEVPTSVRLDRVSLSRNVQFRYGAGKSNAEYEAAERADLIAEIVSYAVGCMFGRYSLDEPGLILADQSATLQDYLAKVPQPTFEPDADNVLPIVDGDWFEDDIVARFRQFLRAAFGEEHFEENLRFVEESLGVKALREYFVTRAGRSKFYDDHVKRYKKRPIYWLFSSPQGSFNALIYMHRYTPSTVSTVLNDYLREFEAKLEANHQHQERLATGHGTPREKAAALKEAERLWKVLVELGEYERDVLYPLASQQIAIDLDDGVKVNYPKFYPALKKITGLEAAE